ncbi:putative RING-H2 finger protein ATL61 [Oryza sativa Japonica Group]|uniref:RING-type E3 ubiquitin transferase n=2 Tax=Oryza sativa TaxID=4530 RepID=Q2RBE8_ORYSJ|nr:putative RING-H2 finger protein ATL61 [Oryza sativa Japonica Group]EAY79705.1 hypothetical protein OsI_34854 [Oryza sativa Indica Group]ABA91177.1 Zinc finger, C3HC4 type family protein [Oryza sativa Japonica Group]KAF2909163.1 hypothetical protein DAI22_11g006700 [Oryza sativa Japonica Group]USH99634.1 zinc finger protein [Oryza sativa Japonica Group]BAT12394.1 Os11g0114000 [Oryza sativa Japonica Group]
MDAEDFMDSWLMWGNIFFFFLALAITVEVDLIRLRRNDDGNNKSAHQYDMLIERLLLLRPKDDQDNEQCVICLSENEDDVDGGGGERGRGRMLPGCAHAFHKDCVVKWLRNRTTCPLCRSDVAVAAAAAADNMV